MQNSLAVVIVNWNTSAYLDRCLDSLGSLLDEVDVYVVDNNSEDLNNVPIAKYELLGVRFYLLNKNLGYTKANNLVINEFLDDYDFFWLLNPDTEFVEGSLSSFLDFLSEKPRLGAVGTKMVDSDGSVQKYYRRFPNLKDFLLCSSLGRLLPGREKFIARYYYDDLEYDTVIQVEQPPGASLLLCASAIREVGLLDEQFPIWLSDTDICYRLVQAGYRIWLYPNIAVMHHIGGSYSFVASEFATFQWNMSVMRYIRKHFSRKDWVVFRVLQFANLVLSFPLELYRVCRYPEYSLADAMGILSARKKVAFESI